MTSRLKALFKANAKAGGRFEVRDEGTDEATVYLYDAIGGWYGVEGQAFVEALNEITAPVVHLRINSPGGDVFDARAIQTAIKAHPAKVIAHIDGLAASAATYIATGCDEVEIADGAFFMVHNAWTMGVGNKNDFRDMADLLEKLDGSILNDYLKRTGGDRDEIAAWMDAETWFTAEEAKEKGFVDRIFDGEGVGNSWNLAAYDNAPAALMANETNDPPAPKYDRAKIERRLALVERGI